MSSAKLKLPNGVEYDQPTGIFIDNKYENATGNEFEVMDPTYVHQQQKRNVQLICGIVMESKF